jgi:segregation and condensation protein B
VTPLARTLEALLFLSPEPLSAARLAELAQAGPLEVDAALGELRRRHGPDTGLELADVAGGLALRTRADLAEATDRLIARPPEDRLSPAALETLAVIAYLEPTTRREVSRLRGVAVDHTVTALLERGLITEEGRARGPGGAARYRTTPAFLERFGLRGRHELPPLTRFELSGPEAEALRRRLVEAELMAEAVDGADG